MVSRFIANRLRGSEIEPTNERQIIRANKNIYFITFICLISFCFARFSRLNVFLLGGGDPSFEQRGGVAEMERRASAVFLEFLF